MYDMNGMAPMVDENGMPIGLPPGDEQGQPMGQQADPYGTGDPAQPGRVVVPPQGDPTRYPQPQRQPQQQRPPEPRLAPPPHPPEPRSLTP